jgi:predicted membrane channel-forming protein YqfA (hemolysin III family)
MDIDTSSLVDATQLENEYTYSQVSGPLAVITAIIAIAVIVYGVTLYYHWIKFALNKPATYATISVFFLVSALLLFLMLSAAYSL